MQGKIENRSREVPRERIQVDWKLLGHEFKSIREAKGVSLEQIAQETRVGVRYLRALEAGRLEMFPGGFYQKAFFSAYARAVGIPEDRVRNWNRAVDELTDRAPSLPVRDSVLDRRLVFPARGVATGLAITSVLALLAIRLTDSGPSAPPPNARPSLPATRASTAELGLPFVSEEFSAGRRVEPPLEVVLRIDETCWLQVRSDGVVVSEGLMLPGEEKQVRANEEVLLSVGNAGGVAIWINGRPGKPLGRSGAVLKNVLITPGNFREFVAS